MNNEILIKKYDAIIIDNLIERSKILEQAALILYDIASKVTVDKLPQKITTQNIIDGECMVPNELKKFYVDALSGPNKRRKKSEKTKRLAKSYSQDFIYSVSNGRIKPSKHICLGITLKKHI